MSKTVELSLQFVLGLIGTVITAFIVVFLVQQGRFVAPEPYFVVENRLLRPIEIYIDETPRGEVDAESSRTFLIDSYPVKVRFEVIRFRLSNDTPLGDWIEGTVQSVDTGRTLIIDNQIGSTVYFYPVITNNTNGSCDFAANAGGGSENRPGASLSPYSARVGFGYYRLYANSNVTLYCDNGRNAWWGTEPGMPSGDSLIPFVQSGSGVLELTLNP